MKCILSFLFLIFLGACSRNPAPILKTGLEGKSIPSFNLLLMDSSMQNTNTIPQGKPVVFLFVSPFCPYCRALTEDLANNIGSLKEIQFYVISPFPFAQIKHFYSEFHLKSYPNVVVGQDYTPFFQNYFKVQGVPYIAIYDKEKKLQTVLIGKTTTKVIYDIAFK